ncbi:MAG: hypothetical protein WDZ31_12295 [Phycisphaeraceae bacterium]
MSAYTQDIFELTLARPATHAQGDDAMQVHLWWRAPQQGDRLVQVYVDGALYDVTAWPAQRAMWLLLDRTRAHRIELLAVDPAAEGGDVWRARPELLRTWSPTVPDVAAVTVLRNETLPVTAELGLAVDDGPATVTPLWPADVARGGFGALFGEGGFGSDAATGPGLGEGELGVGPLGADGVAWHWRHTHLPDGTRTLALNLHDPTGQPLLASPAERLLTIEHLPAPADGMWIDEPATLRWQ